jgi:hypothetical protein
MLSYAPCVCTKRKKLRKKNEEKKKKNTKIEAGNSLLCPPFDEGECEIHFQN